MRIQQFGLVRPSCKKRPPQPLLRSRTLQGSFLSLILALSLCAALVLERVSADPNQLLIFYKQSRKAIPKVLLGSRTYISIIELLVFLDLPYSESASAGFVRITAGTNHISLTKDQPQVVLNEKAIGLSAPVTLVRDKWVVPLDFVNKVLGRALDEKVAVAGSGNAIAIGESDFTQFSTKIADKSQVLRVQGSRPISAEVRQQGTRLIFAFGNTPVDFSGSERQTADWIRSITMEQSESANQLVVELADNIRVARISHLASQNAYAVEATRVENPEIKSDVASQSARPVVEAWKWHHITIDAGHGGTDRGMTVRENVFEKDVSLAIARKVRWALETRLAVPVVLSRSDDQAQSLEERIAAANLARSNLFISIHTGNAPASTAANSFAYTAQLVVDESPSDPKSPRNLFVPWWEAQRNSLPWSERLADCVQNEMNRALNGGQSLSFRHSRVKLLSALAMPAVLVEIGNMHVPAFQAKVESDQFQNLVAGTLAAAVEKFRPLYERP